MRGIDIIQGGLREREGEIDREREGQRERAREEQRESERETWR